MAEIEESKPSRTGGIPLDEWFGASATKALHATMQEFVQATNQTSRRMVQPTWAIAVLTAMMVGAVMMQIVLALR
jgi:hypothetical protein